MQETLQAADGHRLGAYRAAPSGKPRGALVVLQEIFGVVDDLVIVPLAIRWLLNRLPPEIANAAPPAVFSRRGSRL